MYDEFSYGNARTFVSLASSFKSKSSCRLNCRIAAACPELLDLFVQAPLFTPASQHNPSAEANNPEKMAKLFGGS
jgi:hypothetical protein